MVEKKTSFQPPPVLPVSDNNQVKASRFPKPTVGQRKHQPLLDEPIAQEIIPAKLTDEISVASIPLITNSQPRRRSTVIPDRKIVRIPLNLIDKSPYQNRSKLDENYIADLAENIQTDGLNNPISVRTKADGRYELIAGDTRQAAARVLGWTEIDAEIRHVDDNTAARLVFFDNFFHKPLSDYEIYKGFSNLVALGTSEGTPPSQRSLAKEAGISPAQMTRLFSYAKLPTKAQEILDELPNILQANAAESLVRFCDISQEHLVVEAIEQLRDGKLTQGRAAAWIEHRVSSRPTKSERTLTSNDGKQFAKLERTGQRLTVKIAAGIDSAAIEEMVFGILRQQAVKGPPK